MKVCIVGTGSQGTGLAGLLAMEPDVELLTIADYSEKNLGIAKEQIATLGDKIHAHIEVKTVNAGDIEDVRRVIAGHDVVFNGIIPRFNIPIMRACIAERCHYADLFASPYEGKGVTHDETIGAQLELDEEFKKIDRLALPSIGMSPGWTSLAAQYIIDQLDTVDTVTMRWGDFVDSDEYFAPISPVTLYDEWFGAPAPMRTCDGQPQQVDLLESEEEFEFPAPIGKRKIYTVTAHPDIALIPRFAGKPMHICEEKGGVFMNNLTMKDYWIKGIQQAVAAQGNERTTCNMKEEFARSMTPPQDFMRLYQEGKIRNHAVCFSVGVTGLKDGTHVEHICYYTATLDVAQAHLPWASPAVYGTIGGMPIELVLMMGRGQLKQRGVWSVGSLGIAAELNQAMAKRGQKLTEKIERTMGF